MEGYLEVKESSKWVNYFVVIRGSQLLFFKDSNARAPENIQGHVNIGPKSSIAHGKNNKGKFEFEIKTDSGKKYLFRAISELLRLQWVHTLGLAAQGKPPPPLFVANLRASEALSKAENQYTEVPEFNISSDAAFEVTDEDMQKTFVKKHHSFSSHCKKLLGRKKSDSLSKSFDEEESRRPVSEGAEATPEPFYDTFPDDKPPWFFGKLSREESETILQRYGPGRFLVRNSESVQKPGAYTISLKHRDRCRHHKIETLPDGNVVMRGHEDKPFPNLVLLVKYFAKSQEKDICLVPIICEEQGKAEASSSQPTGQESYEIMDERPPAVGSEDRQQFTESSTRSTSPRHPHGYENLPSKPRAKPPPLISRNTEPVLPTYKYQNLPPKAEPRGGSRSPPLHGGPADSYEEMATNGHPRNSSFEPKPDLPPRRPVNPTHGYENLPEKAESLPPREPIGEGYVNLPPKSRSTSDPPELPPRSPRQNGLGYENVPSSSRGLGPPTSSGYQNIPSQAHTRHSHGSTMGASSGRRGPHPPMTRASTLPAHIIKNTLGQMTINEGPY